MKRKKITSSLKSSSQQMVEEETFSYLPNECWECVFRFIINDHDCLNSVSLVSKQFLSITNRLLFSLTVFDQTHRFLDRLFKRFTRLSSLNLSHYKCNMDKLLRKISCFPLSITSLNISNQPTFPTNGLRAFSRKVTTLTSLNCSNIPSLGSSHLLLIADCFPFLKQLNLGNTLSKHHTNAIHSLLSKCRSIQHLDLHRLSFLNDQHVVEFSIFLGDLVSINLNGCCSLTESALFSLVRNCPSLNEIKMEYTYIGKESVDNSDSLTDNGVYTQLNSLYLGNNYWLSDESIIMFASIFPNLQYLDLHRCDRISDGICQVLRRCCKIRHLYLTGCSRVKLLGINFVVPQLEVLDLSNTKVDDETLYVISKNCYGLLQLLLKFSDNVTEKGVEHVVENLHN